MHPIMQALQYGAASLLFLAVLLGGLFALCLAAAWVFDTIDQRQVNRLKRERVRRL